MVVIPINTFKIGSPQVRISNTPNFLNDTATHYYIYEKSIPLHYELPSGINPQGETTLLDNSFYSIYDSNVDGNGKPIYIRN